MPMAVQATARRVRGSLFTGVLPLAMRCCGALHTQRVWGYMKVSEMLVRTQVRVGVGWVAELPYASLQGWDRAVDLGS